MKLDTEQQRTDLIDIIKGVSITGTMEQCKLMIQDMQSLLMAVTVAGIEPAAEAVKESQ